MSSSCPSHSCPSHLSVRKCSHTCRGVHNRSRVSQCVLLVLIFHIGIAPCVMLAAAPVGAARPRPQAAAKRYLTHIWALGEVLPV